MRLLIVSDAWEPQINGVVRTYQNICRNLRALGHTVEVIGPDRFFSAPMPVYAEIKLSWMPARKLERLIDDFKPDAIHIAVEGPLGLAARRYCLKHGKSFTTAFHTLFPDYVAKRVDFSGPKITGVVHDMAVRFVRWFHAPAKATFVATQSLEDQLRAWGFKQTFIRLLRGIDTSIFHTGPRVYFDNLPKPIQIYVGRVAVEKNIEAFLDLPNAGTKVVVGDGPSLAQFKKRYPEAIFTGAKTGSELSDRVRSADVFVFPSKTDTFGMVLIEALACGVPVAAYNVMGPKDIITEAMLGHISDDLGTSVTKALAAPGNSNDRAAYTVARYNWQSVAETFAEGMRA